MITILQDFLLMLLFKELEDCLFLLLTILIKVRNSSRNLNERAFLPVVKITNYNVLIDGRTSYDQPINDQIKKHNDIRKTETEEGDDYTTGCLLDYQYFKDHYQLIAVDLRKQKELDADSRAIQRIEFYGMLKSKS